MSWLLYWLLTATCMVLSYIVGHAFGRQAERNEVADALIEIRGKSCPHGYVDWDDCPVCCH